jgi:ABC-type sugar transport system permease subunit
MTRAATALAGASMPRSRLAPWLLLAPAIGVLAIFTGYPLVQSVPLSMKQTFGPGATTWVGLENFAAALGDPIFHKAVINTVLFMIGSVCTQIPAALGLALLLNHPSIRGRAVLRLLFFSPQLVGLVFVAVLTRIAFEKSTGIVNTGLHAVLPMWSLEFPWLEKHVLATLVLASFWMWTGFHMVFFLAALQNVPKELHEAASIDGAGPVRRFWVVTMPAILPIASFVTMLSVLGSLQLFELPYVVFAGGGPENRGLTIVTYLYQTGFESGDLGYSSAIGWLLAIMLLFCSIIMLLAGRARHA